MITITRTWEVDGVPTDVTTIVLRDPTGAYGVKRNDTGEAIVAAGTAMTKQSTGRYAYTFEEPAAGLDYTAWIEVVYDGSTYRFEVDLSGTTSQIVGVDEVLSELGISSPTVAEQSLAESGIARAAAAVARYLRYDPVYRLRTELYPQSGVRPGFGGYTWEVNERSDYIRRLAEAGQDCLQLLGLPVRSIISLYIDESANSGAASGAFPASSLKTEGVDFWPNYDMVDSAGDWLCRDGIIRHVGAWPSTPGTVKVSYYAGYKAAELQGMDAVLNAVPIWETVLSEACRRVKRALLHAKTATGFKPGYLVSENLGDYSYSVDSGTAARLFGATSDLLPESRERLDDFVNWGFQV